MPMTSEMTITSNDLSQDQIKQWLTELTHYTPQQIDTAVAQLQQQRAETAQRS